MTRLTGWWDRRSDPARFELYTRWSLYSFGLIEAFLIAGSVPRSGIAPGAAAVLYALAVVHAVLCAVLVSVVLDWTLQRRERPTRLLAVTGGLTAVVVLAVVILHASGALPSAGDALQIILGFTVFVLGPAVLNVRSVGRIVLLVLGTAALMAAFAAAAGLPGHEIIGDTVAVALGGAGMTFTYRGSAWILVIVCELDAAREVQSRLAVAEERLRFGRDLHDVLGRNLSVIALKSELAVQLARRGRPEAVDQMVEVQRIARESQREVREVVRGYRSADLQVELAGALSVLRAAGIDGRAEGDDGSTLSPAVQSVIGWVVREGTTNVLRHGDARSCVIRLWVPPAGPAVLTMENDGAAGSVHSAVSGPSASGPPGSGLTGLRERVGALGGTLTAEPETGGIFRLTARVPLQRQAAAGAGARAGSSTKITDSTASTEGAA
ncbi:histidine kinase [Streptomyces sp. H10-C2]|uniref:sensor histidine kinase n=1 Tax=unclassified Streptomyces TaxID=2593676 RepID=UPI0024BA625F|nr:MULTISPECIES: histidine kinase [unclassified Streptomyces]MDJ0345001.1 histidine kinase [Streptomyces sp. PH10-H1]MDJ0373918.1 histidine kinase [Streptomyces sp. H10-C2]